MTNQRSIDGLIDYAQHALGEGYPYEVTEDDLRITLEALKLLRAAQDEPSVPRAERCVGPDPGIPSYATLRDALEGECEVLHLECRFKDGQKYAAVKIEGECIELAALIMRAVEQHNTEPPALHIEPLDPGLPICPVCQTLLQPKDKECPPCAVNRPAEHK